MSSSAAKALVCLGCRCQCSCGSCHWGFIDLFKDDLCNAVAFIDYKLFWSMIKEYYLDLALIVPINDSSPYINAMFDCQP